MNADVQSKLEKLKINYSQVKGQPFSHFFCPILFRDDDDDVNLCKGHIVNQAFKNTARAWTVQREDVDHFYGQIESEFIPFQYRDKTTADMLFDKDLYRIFKPQIFADNKPVDSFISSGNIPEKFTKLEIYNDNKVYLFGLKGIDNPENVNLEIKIPPKDLRAPALVSLIKSAHLTVFETFGYEYALSAGGHFVGWNILGKFFVHNYSKSRSEVLENAETFFKEYSCMIRPVQHSAINFQGTITDKLFFICKEKYGFPWAHIVFIKTSDMLHSVIIPILDEPYSVSKFMNFLRNKEDQSFEVILAKLDQGAVKLSSQKQKIDWPKNENLPSE